jgi:hypothetical protein
MNGHSLGLLVDDTHWSVITKGREDLKVNVKLEYIDENLWVCSAA